jgi:hypothetical protein
LAIHSKSSLFLAHDYLERKYLPPYKRCSTNFLADILSGKKKAYNCDEIRMAGALPRFNDFSAGWILASGL